MQPRGYLCEVNVFYSEFEINKNHRLYSDGVYQSLPVMNGHYPMIEEYLRALHEVLAKAIQQYRRVFAFRVDLHFSAGTGGRQDEFCNSGACPNFCVNGSDFN